MRGIISVSSRPIGYDDIAGKTTNADDDSDSNDGKNSNSPSLDDRGSQVDDGAHQKHQYRILILLKKLPKQVCSGEQSDDSVGQKDGNHRGDFMKNHGVVASNGSDKLVMNVLSVADT